MAFRARLQTQRDAAETAAAVERRRIARDLHDGLAQDLAFIAAHGEGEGRALAFPCNRSGQFDLDRAQPRLRDNYLFARAMMGREYAFPVVLRRPTEH